MQFGQYHGLNRVAAGFSPAAATPPDVWFIEPIEPSFVWFKTHLPEHQTYTKRMIKKIDTDEGRREYSKRLGAIEPVFANITHNIRLKWFGLRGDLKIKAHWLAFCVVHNMKKIQRYGTIG